MAPKQTFLDQINGLQMDISRPKDGLKRVESLFVILKQNDIIMIALNNTKMPSNAKMTFRRRRLGRYGIK
jgi:hypothetical protein